jgi:Co/Zn/Cd efflux system component
VTPRNYTSFQSHLSQSQVRIITSSKFFQALLTVSVFCKGSLCVYCFIFRRYPSVHVFFIDHRNDIVVNAFGLAMSIIGSRIVWYVDPIGAILIGLLILVSWAANAYDHIWLLVGKSAPKDFISKLIYLVMTHDTRIKKVDTVSVSTWSSSFDGS